MPALDWIGYIAEWIGNFIPRIIHVKKNYEGVIFTRKNASKIGPGIHIYLPLWSSVDLYPIKRQTLNLPSQILTTKDKISVIVDVAIIYSICDIYRAIVNTYELQDTIRDICQESIKFRIMECTFDEVIESQEAIDEALITDISENVFSYGIRIENAFITDVAKAKVLKLITSQGNII